jgi:hypothetical protein
VHIVGNATEAFALTETGGAPDAIVSHVRRL